MTASHDFKFLVDVARAALSRGDRRPADLLFTEIKGTIKALEGLTKGTPLRPPSRQALSTTQKIRLGDLKQKLSVIAKIIATAPAGIDILPTASNNPPQAYAEVRPHHIDPVRAMILSDRQAYAAKDIRWVFYETTKGLWCRNMEMTTDRVDVSSNLRDNFLEMSDALMEVRVKRYIPWTTRHQHVVLRHSGDAISSFALMLSVHIDEVSIRALGRRFHVNKSRVRRLFVAPLDDY